MILTVFKKLVMFVLLVLFQVLVFNHIHILGYATPFLYIYFILKMEIKVPRYLVLLLGFILGLTIDTFTNTLGVNAAATVLLAFLQPYILMWYAPRDIEEDLKPERRQLGTWSFVKYVTICVLIHHTSLLMLEYFTFVEFWRILLQILACSVLTILMILAIETATD